MHACHASTRGMLGNSYRDIDIAIGNAGDVRTWQAIDSQGVGSDGAAELMVFAMRPKAAQPVGVAAEMINGDTLDLAGGLTVIHTPGHTPGHVSLLWRSGSVLISGDAAMNLFGRVAPPPVAEDHSLAARSFRRLASFDFETAVFGHGRRVVGGASEVLRASQA